MHPVIRISIFLIFSYYIVQAKPGQLILAGFVLFCISIFLDKKYLKLMLTMIWRLKWFYVSIFVLFGLLTPENVDTESTSYLNYWLNTGLYYSLVKIIALILIIAAVIVFIVTIPKQELIATLIYLSKPLEIFGFSSERFAVRLYLIIDFVEELPDLVAIKTEAVENKSKLSKIVLSMGYILNEIYSKAENSDCIKIQYDKMTLPCFYQWGYLVITVGSFYLSDTIFEAILKL